METVERTQVRLDEKQLEALRQVSSETGRSIASLIREGVDLHLNSRKGPCHEELIERARRAVGKFSSGKRDISVNHDRYLADAFRDWTFR